MNPLLDECKKCSKHKYMDGTFVACQRDKYTHMVLSMPKTKTKIEVLCPDMKPRKFSFTDKEGFND